MATTWKVIARGYESKPQNLRTALTLAGRIKRHKNVRIIPA